MCGDGLVGIYQTTQHNRKHIGAIAYYNSDSTNIMNFRKDMTDVFGVRMTWLPRHQTIQVSSLRIARYLLSLSNFHSRTWRIPDMFLNGSDEVKVEWIRTFATDEACLPPDRDWIRIKSVNKEGLQQIEFMLGTLSIESWITGPNCDKTWYLNIRKEKELLTFTKSKCRK